MTIQILNERPFSHIINGKLYPTLDDVKTIDVINPATEKSFAKIPVASKELLDEAVDYGEKAFQQWRNTSWLERAKLVQDVGKEFNQNAEEIAELLVKEQGKPKQWALFEIGATMEWFEKMPEMEIKEKVCLQTEDFKVIEQYLPLGVCAGIVPWNFPIILMVWKIIPAILTGNTIIIKPSPFTPLCAVRIVELFNKHLPAGVVQLILGDDNLGPWITEHPKIRKISFTGSTATGKSVARSCSATLKRFTLELGGNDACIVLPDIDIEATAPTILLTAMINSGQVCHAAKRIYVHEDIYDKVSEELINVVKGSKVGPGDEKDSVYGPINNKMQFEKVAEFFQDSKKQGHKFLTGGEIDEKSIGYFVPLTLVDQPDEKSKLVQEEPFGPIVPLLKWKTDEEVLKRVNDSEWGLGATIFGKDLKRVERLARNVEAGIVWTNVPIQQHPSVPFGGFKSSGESDSEEEI